MNGTPHQVECPRCAYDLTGVLETWTDSCQIEGTCSECGLEFAWADLLRPERRLLPWLYEHARRAWNVTSLAITVWRVLFPWTFWDRVKIHHETRLRRLAWMFVVIGAPAALFWTACVAAAFVLIPRLYATGDPQWDKILYENAFRTLIAPFPHFNERWQRWTSGSIPDESAAALVAFSAGFLVSLVTAQSALSSAKVRISIITRAMLYSLIPMLLLFILQLGFNGIALIDESLAWRRTLLAPTIGIRPWARTRYPATLADSFETYMATVRGFLYVGYALWLIVYWTCAIHIGMRLRGAWQIVLAGVVIAALLSMVAVSSYSALLTGL